MCEIKQEKEKDKENGMDFVGHPRVNGTELDSDSELPPAANHQWIQVYLFIHRFEH